eukprot:5966786-Pleurochrysis_carterae.AAC.1
MATLQQSNDRATASEKNPSFDELSPSQGHVITASDIEALPSGSSQPSLHARQSVLSGSRAFFCARLATCVLFFTRPALFRSLSFRAALTKMAVRLTTEFQASGT